MPCQVKYLLMNGAVCDSSTFDGERCVYGALTDAIRKLLLDHKMLTSVTKRREAYTEFLRRLWAEEGGKDVVFSVHGEEVTGHRLELQTKVREDFTITEKVPSQAFSWLEALTSVGVPISLLLTVG